MFKHDVDFLCARVDRCFGLESLGVGIHRAQWETDYGEHLDRAYPQQGTSLIDANNHSHDAVEAQTPAPQRKVARCPLPSRQPQHGVDERARSGHAMVSHET